MGARGKRAAQWKAIRRTGAAHLATCLILGTLFTLLQGPLQQHATHPKWTDLFVADGRLEGIYVRTASLVDRWNVEGLSRYSGIILNRLFMSQMASIRTREPVHTDGRPWELSLDWEDGNLRRPFRKGFHWRSSTYTLTFARGSTLRYLLVVDADTPERSGLYAEGPGARILLGGWDRSRIEALAPGRHTLTLRGEKDSVSLRVDGSPWAAAVLSEPVEAITPGISTEAKSCVAFDDLRIRVDAHRGTPSILFEERFDAVPVQTDRLETRVDLDSGKARVAVTWAALAAALLLDMAALALIGRRAPMESLLAVALPQALGVLSLQTIFFLPVAPILFAVAAVWLSKTFLAFVPRPRGDLPLSKTLDLKKPIFWLSLCALQGLHWIWFHKVWGFVGVETAVLVTLIPVILLGGLVAGEIGRSDRLRTFSRLTASALLIVALELTVRSLPVAFLLDAEWRAGRSFWELEKHTNLFVDHSQDTVYVDMLDIPHSRSKPEGVYRVVCLGSSSTAGAGCTYPEQDSYPVRLGARLDDCLPGRAEVINAGAAGYRLSQLRIFYEQVLSNLGPDLLIVYFGANLDCPEVTAYYETVEALLRENPWISGSDTLEAALGLRWKHPLLVRLHRLASRSRLFTGLKLLVGSVHRGESDIELGSACTTLISGAVAEHETFLTDSADRLVETALRGNTRVLLVPEIAASGLINPYGPIFETLLRRHAGEPISMLTLEEDDLSAHLIDDVHMNDQGYEKLAELIARHLVDSGTIRCDGGRAGGVEVAP